VNPDHLVPVGFLGFRKSLVEQDAGIVYQDVGAAEILDGVVEHRLAAAMVEMSAPLATALPPSPLIASTTFCAIDLSPPEPSRGPPRS